MGWGILSDGGPEFLGCWPAPALRPGSAHLLANDLLARRAERVVLLINSAPEAPGTAVLRAFPKATSAWPFHPVARFVMSVVLPHHRQAVAVGLGRLRRAQSQQHAHVVLDTLRAALRRRGASSHDADDWAQEAWLRMARHLKGATACAHRRVSEGAWRGHRVELPSRREVRSMGEGPC